MPEIVQVDNRYPIGKAEDQTHAEAAFDPALKERLIADIRNLPRLLENSVLNLDEEQLNTPYREAGWSVKQVVHHVADSHMNAYIRFKLGLTEDNPVIKPYDEGAWATLSDTHNLPINISFTLLHALHLRWVEVLINITDAGWARTVIHPGTNRTISLWKLLGTYSWHGKHHVTHITKLRERMGWRD